jgi:hypothetical protein
MQGQGICEVGETWRGRRMQNEDEEGRKRLGEENLGLLAC